MFVNAQNFTQWLVYRISLNLEKCTVREDRDKRLSIDDIDSLFMHLRLVRLHSMSGN